MSLFGQLDTNKEVSNYLSQTLCNFINGVHLGNHNIIFQVHDGQVTDVRTAHTQIHDGVHVCVPHKEN